MTILSCPILLNNTAVCYACARECGCSFLRFAKRYTCVQGTICALWMSGSREIERSCDVRIPWRFKC